MKIVGSMIVRDELARYLPLAIENLLSFCDELRIWDDDSSDGWYETLRPSWGKDAKRVNVRQGDTRQGGEAFDNHARARNGLLQFTLEDPDVSVIVAADADEMISDGAAVRKACETGAHVVSLEIAEAWQCLDECLCIRQDGGWRSHPIGCVWRADRFCTQALALADRGHATGRVPEAVHRVKAVPSGAVLYHFGWSNVAERAVRFKRYDVGDGGKFHARSHIDSIVWPEHRVELEGREWPAAWTPALRSRILERANRE